MNPHRFALLFVAPLLIFAGLVASPRCSADTSVVGTIARINAASSAITVHASAGDVSCRVLPDTWITRDGTDCAYSNLRVGDRAVAVVFRENGGLSAVRIQAETQGRRKSLKGTLITVQPALKLLTVDPTGRPKSDLIQAAADSATLCVRDSQPAELNDLQIGDSLTILALVLPDGTLLATRIEGASPRNGKTIVVTGVIKSIAGDRIVVRTWKNKVEETLVVDPKHGPRRDMKPVTMGALHRGDQIIAFGLRTDPGEIDAWSIAALSFDTEFSGTITFVNASEGWVVIAPSDGTEAVEVLIYPATLLQLNGQDADIADIKVGDRVDARCIARTGGPLTWSATSLEIVHIP